MNPDTRDSDVETKYTRELNLEEILRKRGVRLMVFMDGEFSETPRNRAEKRAAKEQLTSVARMQIRRQIGTWGKKKVAA